MYNFSLPVEIGTVVFYVREAFHHRQCDCGGKTVIDHYVPDKIEESDVSMLQQKRDGKWKFRCGFGDFYMEDIGKKIFLTEAEAKKHMLSLADKRIKGA